MALNPFYANIFIDSCAIDPKLEPESSSAKEIFERFENGELSLVIPHSILNEIRHPNTPVHVQIVGTAIIFTIETNLQPHQQKKKQEIWDILTGNGNPAKMKQDAEHVFGAHNHGGYFVTLDKRILGLRCKLHKICSAHIVKPSELVFLIEEHADS